MDIFGNHKATKRPRHWVVPMLHPVTGRLLWNLQVSTKRDALAEYARNIRPDRAPAAPKPVYPR
jgi:hypothetical protein